MFRLSDAPQSQARLLVVPIGPWEVIISHSGVQADG